MEFKIQTLVDKNINLVVPWYLMLSYGYYCLDETLVSDSFFDNLAKTFLKHYEEITHRHKNYVTPEDLKAGTLYHMRENDYPLITRSSYSQTSHKLGEDL